MSEEVQECPTHGPRDCRFRMRVFGVFGILAGMGLLGLGAALLGVMFIGLGPQFQDFNTNSLWMSVVFYGGSGLACMILGIGSILIRRWARALILVCSGMGVAFGAMGVIAMLAMIPGLSTAVSPGGPAMPSFQLLFGVTAAIMGVVMVLAPAVVFLVYRGPDVAATCRYFDTKPRWTDRCPLPVLAVVVLLAVGAGGCAVMAAAYPVFPFFSMIVTGWIARGVLTGIAVLMLLFAVGIYRLRPNAWRLLTLLFCVAVPAMLVSTTMIDMKALYQTMGMPAEQIAMLEQSMMLDMYKQPLTIAMMIACSLVQLGYLIYVRRFFAAKELAPPVEAH